MTRKAAWSSILLSLCAAVAVVWGEWHVPGWYVPVDVAAGLLAAAGLWLCRRWPLQAGLAVVALSAVAATASVAAGIATLVAALYSRPRQAILVGTAGVAASLIRFALRPPGVAPYLVWAAIAVLIGGALTGWGMLARTRRQLVASLAERARRAEAEQQLRAEEARRSERIRIAREMHDVLAHRLSMLAVQAGALEFNREAPAADVSEAAGVIRSSAHLALEELRQVIAVLRDEAADDEPDLEGLIEETRGSGTPVRASVVDVALPTAAYRIVQEAFTNARKHAPGRPVTLTISGSPASGLTIEVLNPLGPGTGVPGAGVGLVGLAERAALAGGRLEHGITGEGFHLRAWLPWPM